MKKSILKIILFCFLTLIISCQTDLDKNEIIPYSAIGGYNDSDEIAPSNLIVKLSFEGDLEDQKNTITTPTNNNVSFVLGKKGKAYKGGSASFAKYTNVDARLVNATSITSAIWIKTVQHTGGAQCLFMLPKQTDFWGNIFALIEGTTESSMIAKMHIQKDVVPAIPYSGQFLEHIGANKLQDMYGKWKHLVWSYNENTSKYNIYLDGVKVVIPEELSNRFTNNPLTGGLPLGALSNSNVNGFILGGYQQHLGPPYNNPEVWMLNYTGLMDEFRMYNVALTDNEIKSLYLLEKQGR